MTSPIDRIYIFALDVEHNESTRVEIVGAGGLSDVRYSDFETRDEAIAYAERVGGYYGAQVVELEPAQ